MCGRGADWSTGADRNESRPDAFWCSKFMAMPFVNFHDTQMSLTSFLEPCYRNWWSSPKVGRSALYLEVSISDDSCFCVKGCHVALPTGEREIYIYIRIHLVGYISFVSLVAGLRTPLDLSNRNIPLALCIARV